MITAIDTIASQIFDRIALESRINGFVDVEMLDGKITLSGFVRSHEDRIRAEEIARDVYSGMIDNDLTIETSEPTEDQDILENVETILSVDPRLIGIGPRHVDRGIVVLEGIAPSFYIEKRAVEKAAEIAGVKVVISEIKISDHRNDNDISNDVELALHEEPTVHAEFLGARTEHGIVTLSGWVPDRNEKENAIIIASRVKGVRDVADEIDVENEPLSIDAKIEREVLKALVAEKINTIDVIISAINGHILLEGFVDTPQQIVNADEAVKKVDGVKELTNDLVVAVRK